MVGINRISVLATVHRATVLLTKLISVNEQSPMLCLIPRIATLLSSVRLRARLSSHDVRCDTQDFMTCVVRTVV